MTWLTLVAMFLSAGVGWAVCWWGLRQPDESQPPIDHTPAWKQVLEYENKLLRDRQLRAGRHINELQRKLDKSREKHRRATAYIRLLQRGRQ